LTGAQRFAAARERHRVVKMEDVDPVAPKALEAFLERARHRLGDAAERRQGNADLGADDRLGGLERAQHATEIPLRSAVAILHGRVEIIDPGVERARHGALLFLRLAAHHEPAHRAAAEAEHRDPQSAAPEFALLHRRLLGLFLMLEQRRA
jgi:hypothetical protein